MDTAPRLPAGGPFHVRRHARGVDTPSPVDIPRRACSIYLMNNAAAAPAPRSTTAHEEDTMIYTDALADAAYDAAIEDACEDPRQYDTLADEYTATGAIRPPAAVAEPVRWVVEGRRMATNRAVRLVVVGGDRAAAIAAARAKWGAVMIDQAGPAIGR